MNEKRKILLFKALKNGRIDVKTANNFYSGKNGRDALISLEWQGYLEHTGHGNFVPNPDEGFPKDVVEKYRTYLDSKNDDEAEASA
ncbi:MAG: hypothetical protein ABEJ56_00105 [Candidatus Nanohaloarchaea archaeon]